MSGSLAIRNQRRKLPVNTRILRQFTRYLLEDLLELKEFELAIFIVDSGRITDLNENHLRHAGSTDVITFDYCDGSVLAGDIFVCADEALSQARQFGTTWQSELARYIIHAVLHLRGYDDTTPAKRRRMKREEERLLREIARRFPLRKLANRH